MRPEEVGLTRAEFEELVKGLGREPNDLELGLFGVLWSEHCSYKSSKNLLAWLPNEGPAVVQGPGENAGVVSLNADWDIAFKIESHNHPSYVEPVQGAATGVGGIIRDVVAMGARPVALADLLRFGLDPASERLRAGVVQGIGQYGNAIGIPTVTGDIGYGRPYNKNPLVNVLCVGLAPHGRRIGASGARVGSRLVLIGQGTGRDGIHGASLLASQDFDESAHTMRPTVQVGDPFTGKLLMEATLDAVASGRLDSVQDLGAAGLTSAVAELCYRSGVGARLWLERVPCREKGMTPYEIMLSETQERMLLVVAADQLAFVEAIIRHYEVSFTDIGEIIADDRLIISFHGQEVAHVPPSLLAGACPRKTWPDTLAKEVREPVPAVPAPIPMTMDPGWGLKVLGSMDCRDRRPIYRQYDSMIQTNTVWGPDHQVAVLRVRGSQEGIAIAVAGPGRWAAVDPYAGGAGAVSRVIAELVCQGAEPLGLTDGINAGNPDRPRVFAGLAALIAGIADAARALAVPVTGGNVSLHNETDGEAIWPTGMIGAVGRHAHPRDPLPDCLQEAGNVLYLLNPAADPDLGGSVFDALAGEPHAYPRPDLAADARCYGLVRELVNGSYGVRACRPLTDGGLFVTLARMMLADERQVLGASITLAGASPAAWLFNEVSGQVVMEVAADRSPAWEDRCRQYSVGFRRLGTVTADGFLTVEAGRRWQWAVADLRRAWRSGWEGDR